MSWYIPRDADLDLFYQKREYFLFIKRITGCHLGQCSHPPHLGDDRAAFRDADDIVDVSPYFFWVAGWQWMPARSWHPRPCDCPCSLVVSKIRPHDLRSVSGSR